jgi:DNA polymerase-3 subunit delta'
MALRPLEAARKVYIIRGAEDLAEEGANALLKTLEEPPPAVSLILTAPDPAALLPTIVSRCQLLRLHPVAAREIADHLISALAVDAGRAEQIAAASGGRPGWAVLAAQDEALAEGRDERATELLRLLDASRLERISVGDALAERWTGHADEVRDALETWTEVWHDVLMAQSGLEDRIRNLSLADEIRSVAVHLSDAAVRRALAATLEAADALDRNAHPRLALEAYTLFLPRLSRVGEG